MNEKQMVKAARRLKTWCSQARGCCECKLLGSCSKAPKDWMLPETETERAIRKANEVIAGDFRQAMNAYVERDRLMCELASITSMEFAEKCLAVVKADANTYGFDAEFLRMESAIRLIARGVSEAHVLEALEKQAEHLLEAML